MKQLPTIVLFGGAFDPIHHAHLQMASTLDAYFSPCEVWFLPTPHPRWKMTSTPFAIRRHDIQLAIQDHPHWKVPLIEWKLRTKGKETYTIDTLRAIKKEHPNRTLIWALGSDQFAKFDLWHESEAFPSLVQLAVIERPGYPIPTHLQERFHPIPIPMPPSPIASATIRLQGLYQDIPSVVVERIIQSGRYFDERVALRLTPSRMAHVRRVAQLAVRLAKIHGVDAEDAYVAAILHDVAREIKPTEGRQFLEQVGIDHHHLLPAVIHAEHGAYLAQHEFGVTKPAILNAIRYHTYGSPLMDPLAKIIYCADKCEPGRGNYTRALRRLCRENLDLGLLETVKADVAHWKKQGSIDPHHPVLQLIQHLTKEYEWNLS